LITRVWEWKVILISLILPKKLIGNTRFRGIWLEPMKENVKKEVGVGQLSPTLEYYAQWYKSQGQKYWIVFGSARVELGTS